MYYMYMQYWYPRSRYWYISQLIYFLTILGLAKLNKFTTNLFQVRLHITFNLGAHNHFQAEPKPQLSWAVLALVLITPVAQTSSEIEGYQLIFLCNICRSNPKDKTIFKFVKRWPLLFLRCLSRIALLSSTLAQLSPSLFLYTRSVNYACITD